MDLLSFLKTFRIISGMVSKIWFKFQTHANDQFVYRAKNMVSNLRAFPSGALLLLFFAVISIGALPWVRSRGFFEVNINNNAIIAITMTSIALFIWAKCLLLLMCSYLFDITILIEKFCLLWGSRGWIFFSHFAPNFLRRCSTSPTSRTHRSCFF